MPVALDDVTPAARPVSASGSTRKILWVARKELKDLWRDRRLLWVGGIVVLLLLVSLVVGVEQQRKQSAEIVAGAEASYRNWVSQVEKNPHVAAHHGMYVYKTPATLSMFDPGIDPYAGIAVWLEAHNWNEAKFRPAQDVTNLQRFDVLSAAWVLQALVPLLIIVLGFGAFAVEREQGTLRQLFSQGMAARELLWGKALAIGAVLAALLVPAWVVMAVLAGGLSEAESLVRTLSRLGWAGLGYAVYFAIFILLSLAVSARSGSSRAALSILLVFWLINTAVAPRVASDLAGFAYPTPTKADLVKEMRAEASEDVSRAIAKTFGVERWDQVPASEYGRVQQVLDQTRYIAADRHYTRLWDNFERQQRVQTWGGMLFPLLAIQSHSMAMAGTDLAHHRDFIFAAEGHRRLMETVMSDDMIAHTGDEGINYKADTALWREVPPFRYRLPSTAWAWVQGGLSMAVLVFGLVMVFALALRMVRRLDRGGDGARTTVTATAEILPATHQSAERPAVDTGPLFAIMRHEFRLMRGGTLWVIPGLLTLLLVYGLYNGISYVAAQDRTFQHMAEQDQASRSDLLAQLERIMAGVERQRRFRDPANPNDVSGGWWVPPRATMTAGPLAPLALGQLDLYPGYFDIPAGKTEFDVFYDNDLENPWRLLRNQFDVAFVLIFLLPLLIFAVSYNLLSSEREQGTLRMLLAQPVSLGILLAGKLIPRLLIVLVPAVCVPVVVILVARADAGSLSDLPDLLLWSVLVIAYGLFWFGLAVAANILGRSSAANMTALIGFWVALVWVLPAVMNLIATQSYPVPSRAALITEVRDATIEAQERHKHFLDEFEETGMPDLPAGQAYIMPATFYYLETASDVDQALRPRLDEYKSQLGRQQELVERYQFLSPAVLLNNAMSDIAGTGLARYRHFQDLAESFREEWRAFFVPKIRAKISLTEADYRVMPSYIWRDEDSSASSRHFPFWVVGLVLPVLLLAGLSRYWLRRYSGV